MRRVALAVLIAGAMASALSGCSAIRDRIGPGQSSPNCVETTYRLLPDAGTTIDAATLDAVDTIVTNRLAAWPVDQPSVESQAPDKLVVRLPRPGLTSDIQSLIGERGQIAAVPIPPELTDKVVEGQPLPAGIGVTPIFTSEGIASATQQSDAMGGPTAVELLLDADAATAFDDYAQKARAASGDSNLPKVALVVDDTVILALTLQSDHFDGRILISGRLTGDDATRLVALANSGPLPVDLGVFKAVFKSCSPTG